MSSIIVAGDVSGSVTLQAPSAAGSTVINLPSTLGNTGTSSFATTDSSGNLGLGVTPSAWYTASASPKVLQINSASIYSDTNINASFASNWYLNSAGSQKYVVTGYATRYLQTSGQHRFYTAASGSADADISFTQAMTLDASGNLALSAGNLLIASGGSATYKVTLANTGSQTAGINWTTSSPVAYMDYYSLGVAGTWQGAHRFYVSNNSATPVLAATIDSSGNLLVGTTSNVTSGGVITFPAAGESYIQAGHKTGTASGAYYFAAYYNGSLVGGLTQSGTTGITLTNLSDYRLKDQVETMQGSLAKILALNPVSYKWKSDGSDGEGFIAHELQAVIPSAATGEKDAVDEEGNAKYQGINLSALVPYLAKAIQEQQAIITQLQADVTALKGQA